MPLIALGLGSVDPNDIPVVISVAFGENADYDVIDTGRVSGNEHAIANALHSHNIDGVENQVITKVWYTHLGYERTKMSVRESLHDLGTNISKIHVLLHWPRCDDRIEWMNCEEEEDALPDYVKEAGPSPLLNPNGKDAAWKGSWKALEEMYEEHEQIISIGISNFPPEDMVELVDDVAIVKPHLYQGYLLSFVLQPDLRNILSDHNILFQAVNVIKGVFSQLHERPLARFHLERIAIDLSQNEDEIVSWPRLVLGFLTQQKLAVAVHSTDEAHLHENSPSSISHVPLLSAKQMHEVGEIVDTLLQDKDLPKSPTGDGDEEEVPKDMHKKATFHNKLTDAAVDIFWVHVETGEYVHVVSDLQPGATHEIKTYKGHEFVAEVKTGQFYQYEASNDEVEDFFSIEL